MQAGNDIAAEYQELFKLMMEGLENGDNSNKEKLNGVVQKIVQSVTALAKKAQGLKDGDWVDPSDPTFIAENELNNAAKSIEAAAAKLALLKPRREVNTKVTYFINIHDNQGIKTFQKVLIQTSKFMRLLILSFTG